MTWVGKTKGGVLGYKFFVLILKTFGLGAAYWVLRPVVLYYFFFSKESTKASYCFFREGLHYSRLKSILYVYRNYYIFGQTLIDKVAVMGGLSRKFSMEHDGQEYLREVAQKKTGGIFISAHIGNYEMAGHLLKTINTKINLVMYDGEQKKVKAFLAEVYDESPVNIIAIKDGLSHIIEINNALKREEIICIHGDRYVDGNKVLKKKFLGRDAWFPVGPFLLVHKLKVPYSFVFAVKETNLHYHFFATEAKLSEGSIEDLIDTYIVEVEKMVKRYPEQWFNFFNFWKEPSTPQDEKHSGNILQPDRAA